jgi:hypothetical protein
VGWIQRNRKGWGPHKWFMIWFMVYDTYKYMAYLCSFSSLSNNCVSIFCFKKPIAKLKQYTFCLTYLKVLLQD